LLSIQTLGSFKAMLTIALKDTVLKNKLWLEKNKLKEVIYLSEDYDSYLELKEIVNHIRVPQKRFHDISCEIKDEYLSAFKSIKDCFVDQKYWTTQLASRNSAGVTLHRELIYFLYVTECIKKYSDVIIIVNHNSLLDLIVEYFKSREIDNLVFRSNQNRINKFVDRLMFFMSLVKYFLYLVYSWISVNMLIKRNEIKLEQEYILIRSWFSKGSINSFGEYSDRNFGGLIDFLQSRNESVLFYPDFFNLEMTYLQTLKSIGKCKNQFIILEHHLTLVEYLKPVWNTLRLYNTSISNIYIRKINISKLVEFANKRSSFSLSALRSQMLDSLLLSLSKKKINIKKIIYSLENNCPEKILINSSRQHFPFAKLVGFQHSVWFKEQLGMFLNRHEDQPLPHEIILKGKKYKEVLINAGFPVDILTSGCNLRYTSVNSLAVEETTSNNRIFQISVILTFDMDQSKEVLFSLNEALKKLNINTEVSIKSHPVTSIQKIKNFLDNIDFDNYTFTSLDVISLAKKSNLVIMGFGSVSILEVLMVAIPLVRVSLSNNFDFDPLWEEGEIVNGSISYSTEELRIQIEKIYNSNFVKKDLYEFAKSIRLDYFTPVSEKYLEKFL
jgi:surface carbohydrate biosynthesis protein (TIGR04326 family)